MWISGFSWESRKECSIRPILTCDDNLQVVILRHHNNQASPSTLRLGSISSGTLTLELFSLLIHVLFLSSVFLPGLLEIWVWNCWSPDSHLSDEWQLIFYLPNRHSNFFEWFLFRHVSQNPYHPELPPLIHSHRWSVLLFKCDAVNWIRVPGRIRPVHGTLRQ